MKDGNSKGLILAFSVVVLLILSSVGTLGTTVNTVEDVPIQSNSVNIKSSANSIKINSYSIKSSSININDNGFNTLDIEAFNNSENYVIANTTGNESYPAMISYGYDTFIAYEYEDDDDPQIYLSKSADFGQSWPDVVQFSETPSSSPTLCYNPKGDINNAYGSWASPVQNSQVVGHFDIDDISKFNVEVYKWDLSIYNSFWNMSNPIIVDYYLETAPWLTCYIGSTNYTDDDGVWAANDTVFYLFQNSSTGDPLDLFLQWDPTLENCSNVSLTTDNTSENIFGVCEKENGSKHDLMIIIGDYVKGSTTSDPYIDIQYYNISSTIDHAHPKIYVKDDNIYIATEVVDIGGIFDIMIYNSSDGGETWGTYDPTGIVMAPPGEYVPKFPTIYANETEIFCTYILDKNLSLTLSNDSGANWTDPIQINSVNGSVVEGYRFSDMPDENHIVWTDDREGNNDLYCIFQGTPPEYNVGIVPGSFQLVATDFPILKTKNYVTYKIRNNGEHAINDVLLEVTVNRTGNTPFTTAYPGFIKYLKPNSELEFKEPLFRITVNEFIGALLSYIGVDFIKLEIVITGAFPDDDLSDNIETIDKSYGDIFPFFSFLNR